MASIACNRVNRMPLVLKKPKKAAQTKESGYHLYEKEMIVVVQKIIELKNKRLTLEEIKNFLLSS